MCGDSLPLSPHPAHPEKPFRQARALLRMSGGRGVASGILILLVRLWQWGPSRALPPSCRYQPTCSAYAIEAITRYGPVRGGWLAAKRLITCHPWGGHGYDPVP